MLPLNAACPVGLIGTLPANMSVCTNKNGLEQNSRPSNQKNISSEDYSRKRICPRKARNNTKWFKQAKPLSGCSQNIHIDATVFSHTHWVNRRPEVTF
jgi:hypothetical protein